MQNSSSFRPSLRWSGLIGLISQTGSLQTLETGTGIKVILNPPLKCTPSLQHSVFPKKILELKITPIQPAWLLIVIFPTELCYVSTAAL